MTKNDGTGAPIAKRIFLYDEGALFQLHERQTNFKYVKAVSIPTAFCQYIVDYDDYEFCNYIMSAFYAFYSEKIFHSLLTYAEKLLSVYLNDFLDEYAGNEYIDWYHNLDTLDKSRVYRNLFGVVLNNVIYPLNCTMELATKQESYILNVFMENIYSKILMSCFNELVYTIYPAYLDRTVIQLIEEDEIEVDDDDYDFPELLNMIIMTIAGLGQFVCEV